MPVHEVTGGAIPARVGVAVATFNETITDSLATAAIDVLYRAGVARIDLVRVPGALELGVIARTLIEAGCQAVVCLGAVIKGETDHYEFVCAESARAITEVALTTGKPVGNGVLTVREYEHAVDRSQPGPSNKGAEAAEAVLVTHAMITAIVGD